MWHVDKIVGHEVYFHTAAVLVWGNLFLTWQDILAAAGNIFFSGALVSTILERKPTTLITSGMTAAGLSIGAIIWFTTPFWFNGSTQMLQAAGWFVIAYLRFGQIRDERRRVLGQS